MAHTRDTSVRFSPTQRIIVLHGAERFLIDQYTQQVAEILDGHFGGIEQFTFDGTTVDPATVLDELRSYGLMQKHKLVVLDGADQFLAGKKGSGDDDDDDDDASSNEEDAGTRRPLMERYAQQPVPDATLLMRAASWRKGKLDALITKCGTLVACDEQPNDRAAQWCVNRCQRRYEASIEPAAAVLMVNRLGPSLMRLDTELQKLSVMAGRGKAITVALVQEQIAPSREEKAWEIQAAIASGSASQMLTRLHDLVSVSRQDWVPISWAVIDLLRKEHAAAHMIRRNMSAAAIGKALRLWGRSVEAIMTTARRLPPHRLAHLLRVAVQSDQHSKSGMGEPHRNLEALMVKIADGTVGDS